MKAIAAAFILMMSSGMDCNSPTGSSGQSNPVRVTPAQRTHEVFGRVINDASQLRVEGSKICLEGSCQTTPRNGYYYFETGLTGKVKIITSHPLYKTDTTWVTLVLDYRVCQDIYLSPIGM